MMGRRREGTVDAIRDEGDAVKCMKSAPISTDMASEPSKLTSINRLEITINLMHVMHNQMQTLTALNYQTN